jgi:hypothetical protein
MKKRRRDGNNPEKNIDIILPTFALSDLSPHGVVCFL